MKMRFIGDVHCNVNKYYCKIKQSDIPSIQVGDFGFKKSHDWHLRTVDNRDHKILFGNHDYYPYIGSQHSLGHYGVWNGVYFIRGAYSIDRPNRTEGIDWFHEEELTVLQGMNALDNYEATRPDTVVSHDCPDVMYTAFFGYKPEYTVNSRTGTLLTACFETHQPKLWIFGHHHRPIDITVGRCRFVCLPPCSAKVFNISGV